MVGVVLLVAVTLLLASTFAVGVTVFGEDLDTDSYNETVAPTDGSPWSGNQGDLVRLSTTRAGATDVSVRVNFTIESGSDTVGNSLNSVYLEVTNDSVDAFSATERGNLDRVEVDENSDGTSDQDITGDVDSWQVQNGGNALKIGFTGSAYTASAGDSIIVVFDGAKNPESTGTYQLEAQTSGDGNWHYGTVDITE